MNQEKIQEYQLLKTITNLLGQTSLETRKRVMEKISNRDLSIDPIGIITECLKEVQLDAYKELYTFLNRGKNIQRDSGTPKIMTDDLERGKSFVESMSSQARAQDSAIQQRRDERYQQMIDEAEEAVSPASRLHH